MLADCLRNLKTARKTKKNYERMAKWQKDRVSMLYHQKLTRTEYGMIQTWIHRLLDWPFYTRKLTPAGGGGRRAPAEEGWYCRTSCRTSFGHVYIGLGRCLVRPTF